MLLTYTLSLAFATQVAQASRLQILSTSNVINAVNDFVPQTPEKLFLGGCSPERAAIVQQAYTDAITIATQAADSLNDPNRPAQVTSLFNKLFNFVIDGVSQSEAVQTILNNFRSVAETADVNSADDLPDSLIMHCDDQIYNRLVIQGLAPLQDGNGDPCNHANTNAYSYTIFPTTVTGQLANLLVGEHIVFCNPFFKLKSLSAIPQQQVGIDMAPLDDDDVVALEKTQPGEMLHELIHRVIETPGPNEVYGIVGAFEIAQGIDALIGPPRNNADTYQLFAITLIPQAKDLDWSNDGIAQTPA